jgi:hypothetical protein
MYINYKLFSTPNAFMVPRNDFQRVFTLNLSSNMA